MLILGFMVLVVMQTIAAFLLQSAFKDIDKLREDLRVLESKLIYHVHLNQKYGSIDLTSIQVEEKYMYTIVWTTDHGFKFFLL